MGDLQGLVSKGISNELWDLLNYNPQKIHAESLSNFYSRVKSFFDEIGSAKNTLIVAHGGTIRMAKYLAKNPAYFNQEEFEKTCLQFTIKNTQIFRWDKSQLFQSLLSS